MSQIDQAFIQAYAPDQGLEAPPAGAALPLTAEPIPAPHFRMPGVDPYADTVAMQSPLMVAAGAAQAEPVNRRRPLSTFVAPEPTETTSFCPVFEVDAFRWPEVVNQLLGTHQALLTPVVQQLLATNEEGRSLIGIAGVRPGVGCSTVNLCLARLLAQAGKSVVLVEGNFESNTLAKSLGLEFETGWEDVLLGRVPLAESVVQSIDDQVALLPLAGGHPSPSELLASIQTSVSAGVLRYHYDFVLFDLGSPDQGAQLAAVHGILEHCRLDASILVADTYATDSQSGQEVEHLMSLFGSSCLGLIGSGA